MGGPVTSVWQHWPSRPISGYVVQEGIRIIQGRPAKSVNME